MNRGLLPGLTRFLTGLVVVMLYYLPVSTPSETGFRWSSGSFDFLGPLTLIPLVGLAYAVLSLRHHRRVPVPGFIFAIAVVLSVIAAVGAQGFAPLPMRSALVVALPWLLIPILLQEMTVDRDRRSLRAVAGGLLVLTLADALVQRFFTLPSLWECFQTDPVATQQAITGTGPLDAAGLEDLKARLRAAEPFAHFGLSNTLAIAVVVLGGFAWAAHFNFLAWIAGAAFLLLFFDGGSFPFVTTKGALLAGLAAGVVTLVRFRPWKIMIAGVLLSLFLSSSTAMEKIGKLDVPSVDFRLSYWQTARNMSESMGPVGVGQYGRFAEMARVDGGHYAAHPHNGFLRSMAEMGLPAALALMGWLASLFAGERRIREDPGDPRRSFIWGACVGVVLVYLFRGSDLMVFRYYVDEGAVYRDLGWPTVFARLAAVGLFLVTVWSCLHIRGTLRPSGYVFAAAAWLFHVFIDVSLFSPPIIVLVAILAALGWQRVSVPSRISWVGFPVVCLVALWGIFSVRETGLDQDPERIAALYGTESWPSDRSESEALLRTWHRLDPTSGIPPRELRLVAGVDEARLWYNRELATRPADPRHVFELAIWLYNNHADPDIVLAQFRRARELDSHETLDRYRLTGPQRLRLNELSAQLEVDSLN